jgi:hypothetical protein
MTFDKDDLARISTSGSERPPTWRSYVSASDALNTVIASGYFNDKINDWAVNDVVHIQASDGYGLYKVTSVTTNVTVEAYDIPEGNLDLTEGSIFVGDGSNKAVELDAKADAQLLLGNGTTLTSVAMSGDVNIDNAGAATIQSDAVTTSKILDANVTEAKVAPNSLTGTVAGNVGDDSIIGGIPILFKIATDGGATGNKDITMTHKVRILDVWSVNLAAGTTSDTVQVFNSTNAITNAMDISGADTSLVRAATIDDANHEIAASGTLRVTETDGGGSDSPPLAVYILAVRVA